MSGSRGTLRFSRFGRAPLLAALFFLAFGLSLALLIPPLILAENPGEDVGLVRAVGWAITAFALVLGSLRGATVIDPGRGEVSRWWGFLVAWRREVRSLAAFDRIRIAREAPGETGMHHLYPVYLSGESDSFQLLGGTRDHDRSQRFADEVSARLGLPIEDLGRG